MKHLAPEEKMETPVELSTVAEHGPAVMVAAWERSGVITRSDPTKSAKIANLGQLPECMIKF
jgi:hypothetical protein